MRFTISAEKSLCGAIPGRQITRFWEKWFSVCLSVCLQKPCQDRYQMGKYDLIGISCSQACTLRNNAALRMVDTGCENNLLQIPHMKTRLIAMIGSPSSRAGARAAGRERYPCAPQRNAIYLRKSENSPVADQKSRSSRRNFGTSTSSINTNTKRNEPV